MKLILATLILSILFLAWLEWQPKTYSTIPNVPGSVCVDGKCWQFEKGKKVRL